MYLVLRRRLSDVTDWVQLGTETMRNARKALGLSYETAARLIPVSSKTYERWEKAGRVPRHLVPKMAEVLGLEIEIPRLESVQIREDDTVADRLDRIERALDAINELLRKPRPGNPTNTNDPASHL
jgi:transcriptional regulator with XRE-family HTH domain